MADISKITTLDGTTYNIKDISSRTTSLSSFVFGNDGLPILGTKTYTNVIATANDSNGAGFFYLKVRPNYFSPNTTTDDSKKLWHVKTRVVATVPGQSYYYTDTVFDIWGRENTYDVYSCANQIYSTSYRPIYYNCVFFTNSTGYANNCGHWIGFSLYYSTNPTNTSYKRTVMVELLAYDNCTVELQDSLVTPTNIPNRAAHTGWYSSTNTSYTNFDAASNGLRQSGDANSTSIHALYRSSGNYVTNSALYRYQLLFEIDENVLSPLNNDNNVTGTSKTMLTNLEFDPFGWIYYYATTTNVSANGAIGAGSLFFHYAGVDLRYTFNCGTTLTAHKPFYLVVTPTENGKCNLASSTPWSQTLPSTNDGNWYILLGRTYSTYQFTLYDEHPVFYYDGTSVKQIIKADTIGNAATVGGHTVLTDVPSGAKFTDTTYESKAAASGGTAVSLVTTGEKYTWDSKQAALVSGTNIKTINGSSLLGSGNLAVSGLPAVTSSDNGKFLQVVNGAWAATTIPSANGGSF